MLRRFSSACCWVALVLAEPASAQTFEYRAPEGCPSAEVFETATLGRLTDSSVDDSIVVSVSITRAEGYRASVEILQAYHAPLHRALLSVDCAQAVDALALATALALDARRAEFETRSGDDEEIDPDPVDPDPPVTPPPPTAMSAPPEKATSGHLETAPHGSDASEGDLALSGELGAALRTGMAPSAGLAVEGAVSLAIDRARVGAGGFYLVPSETTRSGARARFHAYGARAFGCLLVRELWRVGIESCASLELGRLSARGLAGGNVVRGEQVHAPWVALGANVAGAVEIFSGWDVTLQIGLGFPLDRPRVFRFRNSAGAFFEVPAVSSRSVLGARYTFW